MILISPAPSVGVANFTYFWGEQISFDGKESCKQRQLMEIRF